MSVFTKSALLAIILPLVSAGPSGFGHAFSSGPTADGNWIRVANTTLIVPLPPMPQRGLLSLWAGMGTSNGDLIQALVESYDGTVDAGCGVLDGDWCSWASALLPTGQHGGRQILANVGDKVTMSYMYNDTTGNYDQHVLVNGVEVSTYSSSSGKALGWGTAEECNQAYPAYPCGLTPAHDWTNTVLVLNQAQPNYSDTFGTFGASGTLSTSDGGKTWTSDKITIEAWNYTPMCPGDDGYTLSTLDHSEFNTTCGFDFVGGELGNQTSGSVQDCVTTCDETEDCFFAVWDGKTCGLKSSVAQKVAKDGMIAGSLVTKGC